jgi:hypothetical protein
MSAEERRKPRALNGEFYRQMRIWHGWLSAFAFLALIFFALTGIFLNHPEWFEGASHPKPTVRSLTLSADELAAAKRAADPARALAEAVGGKLRLRGAFQSGEVVDDEAMIRLEGVTGSSDLSVDLESGRAEVTIERASLVSTLNDLHRGKNAGGAWRLTIDLAGGLILVMSLIGYVLFFSLRLRLRTSLILTGLSLALMAGVVLLFAP